MQSEALFFILASASLIALSGTGADAQPGAEPLACARDIAVRPKQENPVQDGGFTLFPSAEVARSRVRQDFAEAQNKRSKFLRRADAEAALHSVWRAHIESNDSLARLCAVMDYCLEFRSRLGFSVQSLRAGLFPGIRGREFDLDTALLGVRPQR